VGSADRVVVVTTDQNYAAWASVLKGLNRRGEIITSQDDDLGIIGFDEFDGIRTLVVATGPLGLKNRALKRLFDLSVASLALSILWPVMMIVAIVIRYESRGPAVFVQERVGRDNRLFKMYKFRSMTFDQSDLTASQLTLRDDPRVTRVGAFIRRTSLDELPQLLNVMLGNMSIVGPRPHALAAKAADELYWDIDSRYRHRHSTKPGLTGLAQVRGFRGNTERHEDLTNRLTADLEYLNNWTLWSDIRILLQTVFVLRHSNAF
jgi:polysaccharide biosynthesis protein PslA